MLVNFKDEKKTVQVAFEEMEDGRIRADSKEFNTAIEQFRGLDGIIYAKTTELEGYTFDYDNGEEVVYVREEE